MPSRPSKETPAASTTCPSCGADRPGKFCSACGERALSPKEFGVGHFVGQVVGGLTTLDSKLLGSLRRLVFRPGELTRDWMRGARVKHLRPVQLFLLVNLVVVLMGKWWDLPGLSSNSFAADFEPWEDAMTAQALLLGLEWTDYVNLYDAKSSGIARSTVVILVPIAAMISLALNVFKERRVGVHLVFGAHLVAFTLLVPDLMMMSTLIPWVKVLFDDTTGATKEALSYVFILLPVAAIGLWWHLANRRALGTRPVIAAIQSLVATFVFFLGGLFGHQYLTMKLTLRALGE